MRHLSCVWVVAVSVTIAVGCSGGELRGKSVPSAEGTDLPRSSPPEQPTAIVTDTATTQTHERWRILGSRCRVRRLTDRAYAASVRPCSSVPDNPGGSSGQRVQRGVRLRAGGLDVVEERALRRFVERSALPGLGRPECENDHPTAVERLVGQDAPAFGEHPAKRAPVEVAHVEARRVVLVEPTVAVRVLEGDFVRDPRLQGIVLGAGKAHRPDEGRAVEQETSGATARLEEDRVDVRRVALAVGLTGCELRPWTLERLTVPDQDDTRRALPYRLGRVVADRTGGPSCRRAVRGRDHRRPTVEPA